MFERLDRNCHESFLPSCKGSVTCTHSTHEKMRARVAKGICRKAAEWQLLSQHPPHITHPWPFILRTPCQGDVVWGECKLCIWTTQTLRNLAKSRQQKLPVQISLPYQRILASHPFTRYFFLFCVHGSHSSILAFLYSSFKKCIIYTSRELHLSAVQVKKDSFYFIYFYFILSAYVF